MMNRQLTNKLVSSIFILLLVITFPAMLKAASPELSVSSYVDRNQITRGNSLQLTIEIEAIKNIEVEPIIPQLTGFQIIGQSSSSSSSIQIINGKVDKSFTKSFIYTLSPHKIGKFVIPPIQVKYDGKKYKTKSIRINVIKGKSTKQQSAKNFSQSREDPSSQESAERKMFLEAITTKRNVYVGEPFAIIYKIYSRETLTGLQPDQMPNFPGFIKEDVFQAKTFNYTIETHNGLRYYTYKISEHTLFPTTQGDYKLDPMRLIVSYRVQGRSFFDFGTNKRVMLSSQPITIHVKKLPFAGRPQDFTGAVGSFRISSKLGQNKVKAGESITFTVTISGSGNIAMFETPQLSQIDNISTFPPEEENTLTDTYKTAGYKTIKYIIIPQEPGEYEIPSIQFSYFDTQTGKYSTIATKTHHFIAEKSDKPITKNSYVNPKGIVVQGIDINFIINRNEIKNHVFIVYKIWFWVIAFCGIALVFIAFMIRKERSKMISDEGYYKFKISNKQLKKDFKYAKRILNSENKAGFFPAIERVLKNYLANKLNLSAAGVKQQEILEILNSHSIEPSLIQDIQDCLQFTDEARFSGVAYSDEDLEEKFTQLKKIISRLQKVKFRRKK